MKSNLLRCRPRLLLSVFWLLVNVLLVSKSLVRKAFIEGHFVCVLRDLVTWICIGVSCLAWVILWDCAKLILLLILCLREIGLLLIIIDTCPLRLIKRLWIIYLLILIIVRIKLLILRLLSNIIWNIISIYWIIVGLFLLVVHLLVWKIVDKERKNVIGYYKNKKYLIYYIACFLNYIWNYIFSF